MTTRPYAIGWPATAINLGVRTPGSATPVIVTLSSALCSVGFTFCSFIPSNFVALLEMFKEFQKAADKARVRLFLLQKRADIGFRRFSTAMAKNRSSKVQALYDFCKKTFTPSGTLPPSPQAVQKLRSLLGTPQFPLSSLAISKVLVFFKGWLNLSRGYIQCFEEWNALI